MIKFPPKCLGCHEDDRGFVTIAGCPVHDKKATREDLADVVMHLINQKVSERVAVLEARLGAVESFMADRLKPAHTAFDNRVMEGADTGILHVKREPTPMMTQIMHAKDCTRAIAGGQCSCGLDALADAAVNSTADSAGKKALTRDQYLYGVLWRSSIGLRYAGLRLEVLAAIGGIGSKAQQEAIEWACSVMPPPDDFDVWTLDEAATVAR